MLVLVHLLLICAAGVVSEQAVPNVAVPENIPTTATTSETVKTDLRHEFDHYISSFLEHFYKGLSAEILNNNFTHDTENHPMIDVNQAEILLMQSLLVEHDEKFHEDWPGQTTVVPEKNLVEENNDSSKFAEDGHVLANSIDDSLVGHVHPDDEDDLEQMMSQPPKLTRVRRAFSNKYRGLPVFWPGGVIPYVFDRQISYEAKQAAIDSMNYIGGMIPCIHFRPVTRDDYNWVLVTSQGASCNVGFIGFSWGQNILNLGQGCGYNVAVHEWGHILGAIHTQTRPDRDDYVEMNWPNIDRRMVGNYYMSPVFLDDNDSEYDYASIMHYPTFAFSSNPQVAAMRVKAPKYFDLPTHAHFEELSKIDQQSFRQWYNCSLTDDNENPSEEVVQEDEEEVEEECMVGPWEKRWSTCEDGWKTKSRKGGKSCDPEYLEKRKKCGKVRSGGRGGVRPRNVKRSVEGSDESNDTDRAEATFSKVVEVIFGQPIVLITSNPNNFPIQWYHVVNGNSVKIEKETDVYKIERTAAGNERLVIEKSELKDDGHIFFAKISMSHSDLRVSWDISVDSVQPGYNTTDEVKDTEA